MLGGASIVTYRLLYALANAGVDVRMIVFNKFSSDERVTEAAPRIKRGLSFLTERIGIAFHNGMNRENLFKVSTASSGIALHKHPWVKQADVIALNWINQGLLSLKGIERLSALGKPIVWTMHDMWCLTGICHHAHECGGYTEECGKCQYLKGNKANDLSHSVWLKKKKLYSNTNITFVAVSHWLASCAAKSSLLKNADVRVIPNAFPIDSFDISTKPIEQLSRVPNLIIMGAARLDDPIKGLPMAIEALNYIFDNRPDIASKSMAVFFGNMADRAALDPLRFPHQILGTINDSVQLRRIYASGKVVLSSSLYETLPGTLIEGQAAGCLPVSFGRGGQADIIDHKVTGYIAKYMDSLDLANGIIWAIEAKNDRQALHESVRSKFSAAKIAGTYIELFNELLNRTK